MAIYPTAGLLATAYALNSVYSSLVDNRPVQVPLHDFEEFSALIGFKEVWDFEKKYAPRSGLSRMSKFLRLEATCEGDSAMPNFHISGMTFVRAT